MRRGAALAAAALVALLAAVVSCKPSSLTPFTGTREPETGTTGYNGLWEGQTLPPGAEPNFLQFSVASGEVTGYTLLHNAAQCRNYTFSATDLREQIENDSFRIETTLEEQGQIVLEGRFSSSNDFSGSYFFEGLASTGTCPTSGSGSLVATKLN